MEERVFANMHFSKTALVTAWEKTTPFYQKNLGVSCDTEEKELLKKWLETNNVPVKTETASKVGISFQEVVEWVREKCA